VDTRRSPRPPSSAEWRTLFESAPGLYLVLSPDFTIVGASDAYLLATMTKRDAIVGRNIFDVFPDNPDDPHATGAANLRSSLERVLQRRSADAMAVQKYDVRRPEGGFEERYWSPVNSPVLGADGQVSHIIHRVEDVTDFMHLKRRGTEHERMAEELRSKASRMELEIFQRAQDLQAANRELRALQADLEHRVQARTAELERANAQLTEEMAERQRAEQALRASEDQLRQSQKMEAVGTLAGGVAHDFNNLLTAIMGYAQLLSLRHRSDPQARHDSEEILRAAERAAMLTRQLLAFSRREVVQPKRLDLNAIIRDMGKLLRRLLGERVHLVVAPAESLWTVRADPGHMEQVVMNLAVNARDAMPDGGKLTIETANVELGEVYAGEPVEAPPGSYVVLSVTDTGTGMDPETRSRMFEPFFTTKGAGKGTGLGLSTVYGIVKQWGGAIQIYSDVGWGTSFKIYLPRVTGPAESEARVDDQADMPRGSETVLLAEDQDAVSAVIRAALLPCGYRVLAAPNGIEALEICERHEGPIQILVTDLVMPGMDGPELAARARQVRPALKVLFISGYSEKAFSGHEGGDPGAALLQKPFTPDALARRLRAVLDDPTSVPHEP
jgi:signal transduction histidine kinase